MRGILDLRRHRRSLRFVAVAASRFCPSVNIEALRFVDATVCFASWCVNRLSFHDAPYRWLDDGTREASAIPLTSFRIARALDPNPRKLPGEVSYADSIQGHGAQVFAVQLQDGAYRVSLLHPDHTSDETS